MKVILGTVLCAALAGGLYWNYQRTMACPEWAAHDVHELYIDLADGKIDQKHHSKFMGKMSDAVNEMHDRECSAAYNAFASAVLVKSSEEVRARAAAFLKRWGGDKYQP